MSKYERERKNGKEVCAKTRSCVKNRNFVCDWEE